jgi:hypothetical protein
VRPVEEGDLRQALLKTIGTLVAGAAAAAAGLASATL